MCITINDIYGKEYMPMLLFIEKKLKLKSYIRVLNKEDVHLCWLDETHRVRVQFFRHGNGNIRPYHFVINAIFEEKDDFSDNFYLKIDLHKTTPDSIEFIIGTLVKKARLLNEIQILEA